MLKFVLRCNAVSGSQEKCPFKLSAATFAALVKATPVDGEDCPGIEERRLFEGNHQDVPQAQILLTGKIKVIKHICCRSEEKHFLHVATGILRLE